MPLSHSKSQTILVQTFIDKPSIEMKCSSLSLNHPQFFFYIFSILLSCTTVIGRPTLLDHHTCDYPAIINFGDGNSDTGAYATAFGGTPPFYKLNRGANGLLIIDFLAASLGKPYLHPYLDSLGADFSSGVNFANILATIAPPKLILPVAVPPRAFSPFYLDIQFAQFKLFINQSQTIANEGGVFKNLLPKQPEYFSESLYTIDIGQNEISQGLFTNMSVDDIKAIIPDLINRLSSNVKNIYSLGGRIFWIHNTQPIGCLPYILTMIPVPDDQKDSVGCSKPHNELAQYFNSILKEGVEQLRIDLPDAAFTYVDVYSAIYSIYEDPEKFGFELPLMACCGYGGKYNFGETTLCGTPTIVVNGTQTLVSPCENPSKRINWDGIQDTEAASQVIFNLISTGAFSDPPNSPEMACHSKNVTVISYDNM